MDGKHLINSEEGKKWDKMAAHNVCSFNKNGFCKYQERCRQHHEKNICENAKCVVKECVLRHPKS